MHKEKGPFCRLSNSTITRAFKLIFENGKGYDLNIYCYIIGKMQEKLVLEEKSSGDVYWLDGIEYLPDSENINILYVDLKKMLEECVKKRLTKNEIFDSLIRLKSQVIVLEDSERNIREFTSVITNIKLYDDDNELEIEFDKNNLKYLVELQKCFIVIYSKELKEMSSKFEKGIYIWYRLFDSKSKSRKSINNAKEFFGCSTYSDKEFVRKLKESAKKVSAKLGLDLSIDTELKDRKIHNVVLKVAKR